MTSPPSWCGRWIGLPFEERGRGPAAFDCWGLVRAVLLEQRAVELPRYDEYESTQDAGAVAGVVAAARPRFDRVETPAEGDLVLFRVAGNAQHVGVCVDATWFLHARRGIGSALERWDVPTWAPRVEGFYRVVTP